LAKEDFADFFNPFRRRVGEVDPDIEQINKSAEVLEFAATPYYQKYIDWLYREATKPFIIGNHSDMIQSAVRANTLREIRDTLVKQVELARAAIAGEE